MNIAIFIYDDAEVLDFSGPFEVFSTAKRVANKDWNIFTVAESTELVTARGGFLVQPHYSIKSHPRIDLLIVVGGVHNAELEKTNIIAWIKKVDVDAKIVASVCTGAFLLAKAGLLNGHQVTTHWEDITALSNDFPLLEVVTDKRWISSGKYITSGGISAGIDMSLHLVSILDSDNLAQATAHQMEYRW